MNQVNTDVLCGQINLHKGLVGAHSLIEFLQSRMHTPRQRTPHPGGPTPSTVDSATGSSQQGQNNQSFLICLQEPPVRDNRVIGLSNSTQIFYDRSSTTRPRAAIMASQNLHLWAAPEFSNADMVTCLWKWDDRTQVYIISLYCDILDDSVVPDILIKLLRRCRRKGIEVIICTDSNSHSTLWGCDTTNKRGETFEDFIFEYNLQVINEGDHFTFFRANARTIIDVTLSSPQAALRMQGWKVSTDVVGSDHLLISWQTSISTSKRLVRNWVKGDWSLFQNLLEEYGTTSRSTWSIYDVERESTYLAADIERSLDISHPKREISNKIKKINNLSDDALSARRKARSLLS